MNSILKFEDCFDKILANYNIGKGNKYIILIKLMFNLENQSNVFYTRNCLILLINLCFDIEFADYLDHLGKSAEELSEIEKAQLNELLQGEINNLILFLLY
ncbi:hypothetical protein LCGC14_1025540 [marine sediment metagenome]|uniref:Uncharacterized protein n=1 Tax=marine sediment metagenome TaxID=412755 RepID=A0A0F9R206_9ZZZZ